MVFPVAFQNEVEVDDPKFVLGGAYRKGIVQTVKDALSVAKAGVAPSLAAAVPYPVSLDDVSIWQGNINFLQMRKYAQAVYIRAGYGNNGYDTNMAKNVLGAKDAGMEWGLYWFVKVGKDWKQHITNFMNVLNEYGGKLPAVLDIEYTDYPGKNETTNWIAKLLKNFDVAYGSNFMIYTSAGWWNAHTYRTDTPKQYDLFNAHWTSAPSPVIPDDWSKINNPKTWTLWQYSADGNGLGAQHGVSSDDIDRSRFNGSIDAFNTKFGTSIQPLGNTPPPPSTDWPVPTDPIKYVVIADTLNVRSGPGTNFPIVGKISAGTTVYAHSLNSTKEVWIEIDPATNSYAAVVHGGTVFMKKS